MHVTPRKMYAFASILLFCLPAVQTAGEAIARTRIRSRKNKTPQAIARTADPSVILSPAIYREGETRTTSLDNSGNTALSMIQFPWQNLGYRVSFLGRRPGFRAMTLVDERRIELYEKSEEAPSLMAFDLAHEFGHVVDLKFNDEARRKQWLELRGIAPGTPWFGASASSDYDTPAGDFAETFAYLLLGPGNYHSRMAPPPRPDQIQALAEFCHIDHVSAELLTIDN